MRWGTTDGEKAPYKTKVPLRGTFLLSLQFFEDWLCCVSSVFCVALFVLFCLLMMCLLQR